MTQFIPALHPAAAGVMRPPSHVHEQQPSNSDVNSIRLKAVSERLAVLLQSGPSTHKMATEIFSHCLSLSRGIDYSVAHKEIPDNAKDLPILLKKICQRKGDIYLQAGVMVMMLSVKNACELGWFSDVETQELLDIVNEVGSCFGSLKSLGDVNNRLKDSRSAISTVMSRFYPLMKMGDILASLEAQPGYGAFVTDFHISKNIAPCPKEKIRLFVVQVDNIDTPACIITPQQVNFLLNGKGVDCRTNLFTDTGPQMPTNVTNMLKYGTNLLQVVGQFNGSYLIIVAFMSMTSSPDCPVLLDYVNITAVPHSDSDIIEGPSRISLNCPISKKRIETPVKGQACNHLQCFDFNNYVYINSRRPSWRCPHCNRHVCYTDIRIDQHIVKVLKEVSPNISAVIVTADGSWKAVPCSDDDADQPCKDLDSQKDKSASTSDVVMDLTEANIEAITVDVDEIENQKPLVHQSSNINLAATSQQNIPVEITPTNVEAQMEDEFWSGLDLFYGPSVQEMTIPSSSAASPPLVRADASGANSSQISAPSAAQLHQSQIMNSVSASSPEYGTMQSGHWNVNRTPIAIQALPAQPRIPTMQQRPSSNSNISSPNASSVPSPVTQSGPPALSGFNTASTDIGVLLQHSGSHSWGHQGRSPFTPGELYQQLPSIPFPPAPRVASVVPNQFHNLVQQASPNPHYGIPSPALTRASMPMTWAHTPQVGVSPAPHMASRYAAAQRAQAQAQMSRTGSPYSMTVDNLMSSMGLQIPNLGLGPRPVSAADVTGGSPSDQNWLPAGRMRGSLTGRQYSDAVRELMIQPTPSTQPTRLPQMSQPSPSSIPPQIQPQFSNGFNPNVLPRTES